MHRAVYRSWRNIVAFLLENGAKPCINEPNVWGDTPLHVATCSGVLNVIGLLLEKGAFINQPNRWGQTSLHLAAQVGEPQVVEFLLNNGASINPPDQEGQTPLHAASQLGTPRVVDLLSKRGATIVINKPDEYGETPLTLALQGNRENVTYLLRYGADPALVPVALRQRHRRTLHTSLKRSYLKLNVDPLIRRKKALSEVAELSSVQLDTLKEKVRESLGIVQRLSKAGIELDIESDRQVRENFNTTLTETNRQLEEVDLTRLQKVKLLARIRPILRSGLPLDQKVVTALAQQAINLNYAEGFGDAQVAGASCSALIPLLHPRKVQSSEVSRE